MPTEVIIAKDFDFEEVIRLLERGYNVFEICQKLSYHRGALIEYIKTSPALYERCTEARRQGADALVATYKDLLMKEIAVADETRDRISLIRELGSHIRWEAQAVHSGTYATKIVQEHVGKLQHDHNVRLTREQAIAMAEEVLASASGDDFTDPRIRDTQKH